MLFSQFKNLSKNGVQRFSFVALISNINFVALISNINFVALELQRFSFVALVSNINFVTLVSNINFVALVSKESQKNCPTQPSCFHYNLKIAIVL